jgi:hypothetical protein
MSNSNLDPRDASGVPVMMGYDPTSDQPVAFRAVNIQRDPSTSYAYGDLAASNSGGSPQYSPAGYVSPSPSNTASTAANTDYQFKWGADGTTAVNHVFLQNNTTANVQWELDATASAGSPVLAPGQSIFLDVQVSTLHLYTAAIQSVNGTTAGNIVVRAWQ